MMLLNKIEKLVKKMRYKATSEAYNKTLDSFLRAVEKYKEQHSASDKPILWRTIMKNPITKSAAAAAIIIACFTGLHFWKSTGSGIALADVLTRIEQVTGYTYQVNSITTRQQLTGTRTSTVLVSKEHGIKMTITKVDPNGVLSQRALRYRVGAEWYLLPRSNSLIFVNHKEKTYDRFIYDGVKLDFYKEEYNDPRTIIKQILSCEHTSLGQSVIDGVTVEGFQTTDLTYGGGFFGQDDRKKEPKKVDVKLWVDVNTFLPVRLEQDIITKNGKRIYDVSHDFRWNVIVNPDDFEPHIPEDYRAPAGDIIIRPFNEENAIKGLRLFADNFGKYPASLEKKAFGEEFKRLMPSDPNSYEELSDEERTRKTNESLSLAAPSFLYRRLVNKNKDHAYHGETVKPGDTDKVLLRWKLDDGQYRVIFGDLHADTVTADVMIELEMALPK